MYKSLLCQRYLRTRFIALASIISVMLGVATMIVVNSVMSGFSSQMRDRIHGLLADVVIESHSYDGVADPDLQMRIANEVAGDYIEAVTPTVEVYGMLNFNFAGQWITKPVTIIGIEPDGKAKVGPLRSFLDSYNPVYEDKQVVRPALREPNEVPNWELSPAAEEYRKEKIERQIWYQEQLDAIETAQHPEEEAQTTEQETVSLPVDPFAPTESTPVESADPFALMDGRVYVGAGLVSYPYRDPETGKMKTMKMAQPGDDVKISTVTAGRPPSHAAFPGDNCRCL